MAPMPARSPTWQSSIARSLSAIAAPPGEILRLSEQDLAQTPGRLASEVRSLPMFGGRPVILVKQGPQLTPALFEDLFDGPSLAAYLVVEAGNLKKDAKIRQIFEKAKNAAAIVCYAPDSRSLQQLIREELQAAGLRIDAEALQHLTQHLGADWAVSRSEIAKLMLYAAGEERITVEHVEAVVGDTSAHAFDAAITATMTGDVGAALEPSRWACRRRNAGRRLPQSAIGSFAKASRDPGGDGSRRKLRCGVGPIASATAFPAKGHDKSPDIPLAGQ